MQNKSFKEYEETENPILPCVVNTGSAISVILQNKVNKYGLYEQPCNQIHIKQANSNIMISEKPEVLVL